MKHDTGKRTGSRWTLARRCWLVTDGIDRRARPGTTDADERHIATLTAAQQAETAHMLGDVEIQEVEQR